MSCLRECSELGGGSEDSAAGAGERRSHGGSCHQHHPHYPPDAADHRRQSSGHGHHSDASGGEGAGDGWVRGRREVEVGGTSIAGGHLGGTIDTSGGAATSVEVGGARRKVPQQVHVSSFIRISVYGFPWKSGKIIVWKWLMVIMASILNLFVMGKTFTFLQCKYPGRQCVSARSIIHPTQIFQ